MSETRTPIPIDSALYERAALAAAEDGVDASELVEEALRRTLAIRALGRLQDGSSWRERPAGEVMRMVVGEQAAARDERGRAS